MRTFAKITMPLQGFRFVRLNCWRRWNITLLGVTLWASRCVCVVSAVKKLGLSSRLSIAVAAFASLSPMWVSALVFVICFLGSSRGSRLGDALPAYPSDPRDLSKGNILPRPIFYNSRALEVAESTGQRTGCSRSRAWNICQLGRRATDDGTSTYTRPSALFFFNVPALS